MTLKPSHRTAQDRARQASPHPAPDDSLVRAPLRPRWLVEEEIARVLRHREDAKAAAMETPSVATSTYARMLDNAESLLCQAREIAKEERKPATLAARVLGWLAPSFTPSAARLIDLPTPAEAEETVLMSERLLERSRAQDVARAVRPYDEQLEGLRQEIQRRTLADAKATPVLSRPAGRATSVLKRSLRRYARVSTETPAPHFGM